MKRPRRRRKAKFGKHISISARDPEWEAVQRNAKLRGLSIARYLVLLVERDAAREGAGEPAGPALALKWDEQRELLEAVREIRTLMLEGADAAPLVSPHGIVQMGEHGARQHQERDRRDLSQARPRPCRTLSRQLRLALQPALSTPDNDPAFRP